MSSNIKKENTSIDTSIADSHASYPGKKDSTASQDTKYSVEYTMDVAVKDGQNSMPDGLAKVLELLNNSLNVCSPSGTLDVNSIDFKGRPGETAMLIATYKNNAGLFEPAKIQIPGQKGQVEGESMIFKLPIEVGKTTSYIVSVSGLDKKIIIKTTDIYTNRKDNEMARMERERQGK